MAEAWTLAKETVNGFFADEALSRGASIAYYKVRDGRIRNRIFEMVKAVGAASHAEVLGGRKKR